MARSAQRITGGKLPALQDTYSTLCPRKAKKIIEDNIHPSHCLFTPLPSRRRGQYRCIKAGTERLKNSFLSQGHQTVKQPSLAQRSCCLLRLEIIGHFNKWNTSHFNNATLMFTYLALLISYLYTVFYTNYAALSLLIHIFIFSLTYIWEY